MNDIFTFMFFSIGVSLGLVFAIGLIVVGLAKRQDKNKTKPKKCLGDYDVDIQSNDLNPIVNQPEVSEIDLEMRIVDKQDSWSDTYADISDTNSESNLLKHRQREDGAYNNIVQSRLKQQNSPEPTTSEETVYSEYESPVPTPVIAPDAEIIQEDIEYNQWLENSVPETPTGFDISETIPPKKMKESPLLNNIPNTDTTSCNTDNVEAPTSKTETSPINPTIDLTPNTSDTDGVDIFDDEDSLLINAATNTNDVDFLSSPKKKKKKKKSSDKLKVEKPPMKQNNQTQNVSNKEPFPTEAKTSYQRVRKRRR